MSVSFLLLLFVIFAFSVHLGSCLLVLWRYRGPDRFCPTGKEPPLSVIRPVCGLEPGLVRMLASTFTAQASDYEVIFCVADATDPAIAVARRVMAEHPNVPSRLLIGQDRISGNPKLNNLAKGWAAAKHDWIVMIDSNVLLPPNYVQRLFETWTPDTGLVSSPPVATEADGFAANLEAAFLNTHQDIWQLAADQVGQGFAQGKVLFWHRDMLDTWGGLEQLGNYMAEDVAATKLVRAAGRRVRVVARPFVQPLGRRSFSDVWTRQVRWARVRKDGFPGLFVLEILSGGLFPMIAVCTLAYLGPIPALAAGAAAVVWYGAQWMVAARAGWPRSTFQLATWLLRDLMIPAIWITAIGSRDFTWRGNAMKPEDRNYIVAE